jgi:NADH dehydrogenase
MTLLVIGGTSKVGQVLVPLALRTRKVRVATRSPGSGVALALGAAGAELVQADLRDPASLERALRGVTQVVASAHGFPGSRGNDVQNVDLAGHRSLIEAARRAGVGRFLYISAVGARPDAPVDLFRAKWEIEQRLAASGLPWTSLRATAFMEFWAELVGRPVLEKGWTVLLGGGRNPINFVSAGDVARLALTLLDDPGAVGQVVELGGPENLTLEEVATRFGRAAGRAPMVRRVPLPVLRFLRATLGCAVRPVGRVLGASILTDTEDMTFDPSPTLARWPMRLTSLDELIAGMPRPAT